MPKEFKGNIVLDIRNSEGDWDAFYWSVAVPSVLERYGAPSRVGAAG
jgi:hypothetical protein